MDRFGSRLSEGMAVRVQNGRDGDDGGKPVDQGEPAQIEQGRADRQRTPSQVAKLGDQRTDPVPALLIGRRIDTAATNHGIDRLVGFIQQEDTIEIVGVVKPDPEIAVEPLRVSRPGDHLLGLGPDRHRLLIFGDPGDAPLELRSDEMDLLGPRISVGLRGRPMGDEVR